ncbi:MAG: hypothetical protein LQ351_005009 [Letrouitia transgressa]|nr:MAG: hypothetical protein LQ351_005009 [Letrouitia transgressa]
MFMLILLQASLILVIGVVPRAFAAGFRTIGSSGCAVQMVFLPPNTSTAVFLDNYHPNYGGPGVNLDSGAPSTEAYVYDGTDDAVFGTEYNLETNSLRKLRPQSNTFCSAGAFYRDGTLVNIAGAEPNAAAGVGDGFDRYRTYAPGPCDGDCTQDWNEQAKTLQSRRWYPSPQTLVDGNVVVVGGSNAGGLVLNEAGINVPTYEKIYQDNRTPPAPVTLPILEFSDDENQDASKSYNLYPILHLLPNKDEANRIFTAAGTRAVVWDYDSDKEFKSLPDIPLQPRTFPSSATSVLLPLRAPDYKATVLICGGSSGDKPAPKALNDCYTINPLDDDPEWERIDDLPNGPQTMSEGILLPDGTVLILNGARKGSGGGFMADEPVLEPLIYDHSKPKGERFATQPATKVPRMYHSAVVLLSTGEALVAGSNPAVGYSADGKVGANYPHFFNNGHEAFLEQQQGRDSSFPTEYRVEVFTPPYLDGDRESGRPQISWHPNQIKYGDKFCVKATKVPDNDDEGNKLDFVLVNPGFHTHAVGMGMRLVGMEWTRTSSSDGDDGDFEVTAPRDASVMQPGVYLLFVVRGGTPSGGVWVQLWK